MRDLMFCRESGCLWQKKKALKDGHVFEAGYDGIHSYISLWAGNYWLKNPYIVRKIKANVIIWVTLRIIWCGVARYLYKSKFFVQKRKLGCNFT